MRTRCHRAVLCRPANFSQREQIHRVQSNTSRKAWALAVARRPVGDVLRATGILASRFEQRSRLQQFGGR